MPIGVYPRKTIPVEQRFWNKVRKTKTCWIWIGSLNSKGYGTIGVPTPGQRSGNRLAHRISYEIKNGPIPKGLFALHKCDNPLCVRPDHIFLGTQQDNIQDMCKKGRQGSARGIKNKNSKLDDKKIKLIRDLYKPGFISYEDIGNKFGVSKVLIGLIIRRKIWKHI